MSTTQVNTMLEAVADAQLISNVVAVALETQNAPPLRKDVLGVTRI